MAQFDIKAIFKVEGLSDAQKAVASIGKAVNSFSKDFDDLGKSIGTAVGNIAKFGATVTAAAGGVVALTVKNAELNASFDKLSKQTGISAESLQETSYVADQIGVSQESLSNSLKKFSVNLGDARNKTGAFYTELEKTNPVLLSNLRATQNVGDAFNQYINYLRQAKTEQDRNNQAMTAFGKAGLEVAQFARISAQETANLTARARELGIVLSNEAIAKSEEFGDKMADVRNAIQGTARQFTSALEPAIAAVADKFIEFINRVRPQIVGFAENIVPKAIDIVEDLFTLIEKGPDGTNLNEINSASLALYDTFQKVRQAFIDAKNAFQPVYEIIDRIAKAIGLDSGLSLIVGAFLLKLTGALDVLTASLKLLGGALGVVGAAAKGLPAIGKFAGDVATKAFGGSANGFAGGGFVSGPGTGTSDSIPANLSDGEFVMKAAAVRKFGTGFMHAINNGILPMIRNFADGGLASNLGSFSPSTESAFTPALATVPGGQISGRPLHLHIPNGDVIRAQTDEDTARKLERTMRKNDQAKITDFPRTYK